MPISERKLAANRANAKRSTGPRTRRGKTVASMNALVHGLTARTGLLPGEDESTFRRFVRRMLDELRPDGALQEDLAGEVIQLTWKLRRVPGAEGVLLAEHHAEKEEADANGGFTRNTPLKVLCGMLTSRGVWSGKLNSPLWTLDRYALRIERARALALRMLLALQKRKRQGERAGEVTGDGAGAENDVSPAQNEPTAEGWGDEAEMIVNDGDALVAAESGPQAGDAGEPTEATAEATAEATVEATAGPGGTCVAGQSR